MKKSSFCSFLFLIMLISMCVPSYAEEGFIEIYRNDSQVVSININSVEYRNGYVVAWQKIIPRGEILSSYKKRYGGKLSYILYFDAYDPKYKRTKAISGVYYDKSGNAIKSLEFIPDQWEDVVPNTVADLTYDSVIAIYENKQK